MAKKNYKVKKNEYGFYQVIPTPSEEEIAKFYADEFYTGEYKNFNESSLEVQLNDKEYLCIMTEKNNCKENDLIGIYCNDNLIKTMIISFSKDNYLLIENETISYDTQKRYSFLELNLQNNLTVHYR